MHPFGTDSENGQITIVQKHGSLVLGIDLHLFHSEIHVDDRVSVRATVEDNRITSTGYRVASARLLPVARSTPVMIDIFGIPSEDGRNTAVFKAFQYWPKCS